MLGSASISCRPLWQAISADFYDSWRNPRRYKIRRKQRWHRGQDRSCLPRHLRESLGDLQMVSPTCNGDGKSIRILRVPWLQPVVSYGTVRVGLRWLPPMSNLGLSGHWLVSSCSSKYFEISFFTIRSNASEDGDFWLPSLSSLVGSGVQPAIVIRLVLCLFLGKSSTTYIDAQLRPVHIES